MLTIKSNFNSFRDRLGQEYTDEDLTRLASGVLSADIVNFRGNNDTNMGRGFPSAITLKFIDKIAGTPDSILVINDISLHMTKALLEAGYKRKNIYLAYGRWMKNGKPCVVDHTVLWLMKNYIKANFNEALNVISLEDIFMAGKYWGLIIANPPYGRIGANITKNIIDNVDFDEYVNLLPLKDYTLETGKYIDFASITVCPPHSFGDADILTHVVNITKTEINSVNNPKELCAIAFTVDQPMIKFMRANELKNHYAIDNIKSYKPTMSTINTFLYSMVAVHSQHTCGFETLTSDTVSNAFNFKNEIKSTIVTKAGNSNYKAIQFSTQEERTNFINFYKANRNFINRMIANQFIGIRDDAACFPKVDWTKDNWTVEKVLKEIANYTDNEIKAVLDTMDKDYVIKDDDSIQLLFGEWL